MAEEIDADAFCGDFGDPALSSRVAFGALLVKEREGLTDRGTVETILENPYMQFFLGPQELNRAFCIVNGIRMSSPLLGRNVANPRDQ